MQDDDKGTKPRTATGEKPVNPPKVDHEADKQARESLRREQDRRADRNPAMKSEREIEADAANAGADAAIPQRSV